MSMIINLKINFFDKIKALIHGFKLYSLHLLKLNKDPEICFFKKKLFKNSLAIDIGANGADWTLSLSEIVGKKGMVIGFEPHPYFYLATKYAILFSLKKNIKIFELALGSENKPGYLLTKSNKKKLNYRSKISQHKINDKISKTSNIEIKKLDSYIDFLKGKLSILKIDVEGYEFEVIKGALKTISIFHPIIIYEVNNDLRGKKNFYEINNLLKNYGYNLFFVDKKNKLVKCNEYDDCINNKSRNLIAISSFNKYSF